MWEVKDFVHQLQDVLTKHAGDLRDQEHSSLLSGDHQTAIGAAIRADETNVVSRIVSTLAKRYFENA